MLSNIIDNKIIEARRNTDTVRLTVLQQIKAAFMNKATEPKRKSHELTTDEENKVLLRLVKEHEDSINQYTSAGRKDLVEAEQKELNILNEYAPKIASVQEVADYTDFLLDSEFNEPSMKIMGQLMKKVKEKYSTANGNVVRQTLQKRLN